MEKYVESFSITVDGDETGEKWHGLFKTKTKLSHRDSLTRDRVYREHVGKEGADPSPLARDLATIFSELAVRLIDAPTWWTEQGNGVDMLDSNVVVEVYTQAIKAGQAAKKEIEEKAKAAAEEMK